MQFQESLSKFPFLLLRLALKPREPLKLPAWNKGNTLRGAFGTSFHRLVCVPECRNAHACPLAETCPYKLIFEPSPPQGSDRLSKNQDIPRPFVFRPPLDTKTTYETGEAFEFELVLLGAAVNYLPYFVLAFREVMNSGFGLNRARCELTEVRAGEVTGNRQQGTGDRGGQATGNREQVAGNRDQQSGALVTHHSSLTTAFGPSSLSPASPAHHSSLPAAFGPYSLFPVTCHLIYSSADGVFHQPEIPMLGSYVNARLAQFSAPGSLSPIPYSPSPVPSLLVTRHSSLATVFLTPTYLRAEGQLVREPEFHHLFKRLRDRLNALTTFYGPGPIDADFKALGNLAEKVKTVRSDVRWVERYRTSSKTHQRHELSGFVGTCVYNFAGVACSLPAGGAIGNLESVIPNQNAQEGALDLQSGISNPNAPASPDSAISNPNAQRGSLDFQSAISNPNSQRSDFDLQSGISNQDVFSVFLPWLLAGEIVGVGRHSAFGNGMYRIAAMESQTCCTTLMD